MEIKGVIQGMIASQSRESVSHCDKCGEPLQTEIQLLDKKRLVPRMCKCAREEYEEQQRQDQARENQNRLESLMKNSLMDESFYTKTFDNWDFAKGSRKMYNLGVKYAERFRDMKAEGIGLLVHGTPGNGKTFLACSIANRLLQQFIPVTCVSINGLLSRIKETFNKWGKEAEEDILRGLERADLLIIDDLGTEQKTDWSVSTIYNIIDSRYRSKLPLIITTNLQIDQTKTGGVLADLYERRTEDRIFEMCTPVANKGASIRLQEAKRKTEILRGLFEEA